MHVQLGKTQKALEGLYVSSCLHGKTSGPPQNKLDLVQQLGGGASVIKYHHDSDPDEWKRMDGWIYTSKYIKAYP